MALMPKSAGGRPAIQDCFWKATIDAADFTHGRVSLFAGAATTVAMCVVGAFTVPTATRPAMHRLSAVRREQPRKWAGSS